MSPYEGGLGGYGGGGDIYWPRVNLDEEKQRGSAEEGARRRGGEQSISRLRTQPASLIHPRDVFSSSPPFFHDRRWSCRSPPSRFQTRQSHPRRRRMWQVPAAPAPVWTTAKNVIGFWSATRRFRRLELPFLHVLVPQKTRGCTFRSRFRERSCLTSLLHDRADSSINGAD